MMSKGRLITQSLGPDVAFLFFLSQSVLLFENRPSLPNPGFFTDRTIPFLKFLLLFYSLDPERRSLPEVFLFWI